MSRWSEGRTGRRHALRCAALGCWLLAVPVAAQPPARETPPPTAAPTEAAPPQPIPVPEVLPRADAALARLRELDAVAAPEAGIQEIATAIEPVREDVIADARDTRRNLETLRSLDALRELESSWRGRQQQLTDWAGQLAARAGALDAAYAEATALRERWRVTEDAARQESDTPRALRARIDEVQAAITRTRNQLSDERGKVLEIQKVVTREQARSDELMGELARARSELERELLVRESLPLWDALSGGREPLVAPVASALATGLQELRAAWPPAPAAWVTLVLVLSGCLFVVMFLRQRAARLADEDPSFDATARLFERPISVALVLAMLVLRMIWGPLPGFGDELMRLLLLLPALRLLDQVVGPTARRPVLALAGFFVVDRARQLLEDAPRAERLVFAVEMMAACIVLLWLLRPARVLDLPAGIGRLAPVGRGLKIALALCAFAFAANLIGYARLAFVAGDGALRSMFLAVAFYAVYRVADGLVAAARRAWPLNLLNAVRHRPFAMRQRTRSVLRALAFAGWAFASLEMFTVRDDAVRAVKAVLGATLELGELSISLGDVLAFALTIWAALLIARGVRFLLDEDVFPRMRLPRGVPYAISATVQYAAVLVAFFLALAVTGISLTQFTILAGAFGVGVGFGLQNVVNGFVSGLILLYERPVQVGDTVQIADVQGKMRRIGIRSSTVRTFEGAEVIVPNASLIAERVVNWTLSQPLRRIDIDVAVDYGTDPARVIGVLGDVAKGHRGVLDDPAPQALFNRFGATSVEFQLRVWTSDVDDAAVVRSELGVAIFGALAAAGIGKPVGAQPAAAPPLAPPPAISPPPPSTPR
jgi:small-conductance mechanosensitive channel